MKLSAIAAMSGRHLPPTLTREQRCGIHLTFQGLTVHTRQFGTVNWFDPWLPNCDKADRQAVYAAKRARPIPDTHQILWFATRLGGWYGEPNPEFERFPDVIGEPTPDAFLAMVEEVLANGFVPILAYDGDNGDNPVNGFPNALRQLPILAALLRRSRFGDLNKRVLLARFFDGVFYGSSPENIERFGTAFAQEYDDDVCLAIQHNGGHIPVGNGPVDYEPGGMMARYDVVCSEYDDNYESPSLGNQTIWQVNGRLERHYVRPPDQVGDPDPPFYLIDTPRGRRYHCAMEGGLIYGAYGWVRNWTAESDCDRWRQYERGMGCQYTG